MTPRQAQAIKYPVTTREQAASEIYVEEHEAGEVAFRSALIVATTSGRYHWRAAVTIIDKRRRRIMPSDQARNMVAKRARKILDEMLFAVGVGEASVRHVGGDAWVESVENGVKTRVRVKRPMILVGTRPLDDAEVSLVGTSLHFATSAPRRELLA